jgi:small subunit ribosomal protein S6
MRDYELMTIHRPDLAEDDVETKIGELEAFLAKSAAEVTKRDMWGKRRFAYEIDHKSDGTYVVLQFVSDGSRLDDFERWLRLADEIVRHKLIRLPDHEAAKRGLLAAGTPATAG